MDKLQRNNKAVAIWLLIGVGMLVIQSALGGITRLTGSGLSITEWNVVTGTLPPMNNAQWLAEFNKYQQTPQYHLLNNEFNLSDFKSIFFWEWFHRLWARLMFVVFFIGFFYFLFTKKFSKEVIIPFIILVALGAMQGLVGWIMVKSGFVGDAIYVAPVKLALHFVFAMFLLCYTFWFALQLLISPSEITYNNRLKNIAILIAGILVLQLGYGALMAGHKAATYAATWPTINGSFLSPMGLYNPEHGLYNFIDNKIMVHFMHRGLAYILLLLIIFFARKAIKINGSQLFEKTKLLPLKIVVVQVLLGIGSVLSSVKIQPNRWGIFEWTAQIHQLVGMCLLLSIVWMLFITKRGNA